MAGKWCGECRCSLRFRCTCAELCENSEHRDVGLPTGRQSKVDVARGRGLIWREASAEWLVEVRVSAGTLDWETAAPAESLVEAERRAEHAGRVYGGRPVRVLERSEFEPRATGDGRVFVAYRVLPAREAGMGAALGRYFGKLEG